MAKQRMASPNVRKHPAQTGWVVISVVALVVYAGLTVKIVFKTNNTPANIIRNASNYPQEIDTNDARVQLVVSRFRCAWGGCGELPLDECTCDMPRGAVEEKNFIRKKLKQGLTIDQAVKAVNEKYGHMKS